MHACTVAFGLPLKHHKKGTFKKHVHIRACVQVSTPVVGVARVGLKLGWSCLCRFVTGGLESHACFQVALHGSALHPLTIASLSPLLNDTD